jgi:hypothetical protein
MPQGTESRGSEPGEDERSEQARMNRGVGTGQARNQAPAEEPAATAFRWAQIGWILLLALLLASLSPFVLGAILSILFPYAGELTRAVVLLFGVCLATFPLGYWAGHALPGRHPRAYVLLGLCVGLVEFLPLLAIRVIFFGVGGLSEAVLGWFILYESGVTLVFISGALFGDMIERRTLSSSAGLVAAAIGLLGAIIGLISTIISALS